MSTFSSGLIIQVSQAMKATYVCGLKGKQNLQNLNNLTSLYHETGSIGERKTYET